MNIPTNGIIRVWRPNLSVNIPKLHPTKGTNKFAFVGGN
jgi:hypothetical protein